MGLKLDDYFEEERERIEEENPRQDGAADKKKASDAFDDSFEDDYIIPDSYRRKRRLMLVGGGVLLAVVLLGLCWWLFFASAASEGQVRGYVLSIEKRGNLFESYEGVLVVDFPQAVEADSARLLFPFSTRDVSIGRRINRAMAADSMVVLRYDRYRKSLPWRGETATVVSGVDCVKPTPLSRKKP